MIPNLDQNPFRSLPYILVQLPAVARAATTSIIGEIKLPSLFHTSSRRLSTGSFGTSGNLSSRSSVVFESGTRGGDCTAQDKEIEEGEDGGRGTGSNRHRNTLPLSTYALYSSVVSVVERLFFLSPPHSAEWIEDEEQHTDWSGSSYFPSNAGSLNGVAFPGIRPNESTSFSNYNSINPSRSVSGLAFALASSNAGGDMKSSLDGCYQPYGTGQITSNFSRSALSFSQSPPLSPAGAHSRDARKTLRPQDLAFSSSLSAVVEDSPSAYKIQKHMLPHTREQETASFQDRSSNSNSNNLDGNEVRGSAGAVAGESQSQSQSHKEQPKVVEGVQGGVGLKSYGSPVRSSGAISGLSQSLQKQTQNQNQNQNQIQNQSKNESNHHQIGSFNNNNPGFSLNLPIPADSPRSPLLSPYMKSATGSAFVPSAPQNRSPSWRARDRDRDRSTIRSTGGGSGLSRMQSLGGGPGHYSGVGPGLGPLPSSHTVSGGMDVKAMIGEAKRRSDQRLKTDHQYLNRMAFACVRVGPTGFVWLSNVSGRVSKRTYLQ